MYRYESYKLLPSIDQVFSFSNKAIQKYRLCRIRFQYCNFSIFDVLLENSYTSSLNYPQSPFFFPSDRFHWCKLVEPPSVFLRNMKDVITYSSLEKTFLQCVSLLRMNCYVLLTTKFYLLSEHLSYIFYVQHLVTIIRARPPLAKSLGFGLLL